jgi:phosphoribosylamine--glycine ligase
MKVLVVGSGGREDALAWRLARDSGVEVATVPGNPGSARWGSNIAGAPEEAAASLRPDLVVIGPEAPLADGLADRLRAAGFAVFGPGADGAMIESSKIFAKDLMIESGIPTADFRAARTLEESLRLIEEWPSEEIVIKADGLASGKGVTVAHTRAEARAAIEEIFVAKRFGEAGRQVLLEEVLKGREASVLAITDGTTWRLLPAAEDHKAVFEGDRGPNTGGMGAISPTPVVTPEIMQRVEEKILAPILASLRRRGITYRGIIYAGLMVENGAPRVIEFNCRFGDPETQAILPRVTGHLGRALLAAAEGRLAEAALGEREDAAACVVLTAEGYPGEFRKGLLIEGFAEGSEENDRRLVFVSGAVERDGRLVSTGGRVLSVVGLGPDLEAARGESYAAADAIGFEGMHLRRDIGRRERPS